MKNHDLDLLELNEHMRSNNLLPDKEIIVDNQRHVYWTTNNGSLKPACYIATQHPVGKRGPRLICSYGLVDHKQQFSYSSSE